MAMAVQTDKEIMTDFLLRKMKEVVTAQSSKGLKASGKSAYLLRVEASEIRGALIDGSGSFEFQEFGRRAGGFPPIKNIYDWLQYKKYGMNWKTDSQRKSLAFLIARKIAREGTKTNREGRQTGVLAEAINKEAMKELIERFAVKYSAEVTTDVTRLFKTIFTKKK